MKTTDPSKMRFQIGILIVAAMSAISAFAQTSWNVVGHWDIGFFVQQGRYTLPMTITNQDFSTGVFTGIDNQGYSISGQVNGSNVTFYDAGYPCWSLSFTGVINNDGTMSGGQGSPGSMTYYNCHGPWGGWFWTDSGKAVSSSAPVFILQPISQIVGNGQSVTFAASASGYPSPLYQWRYNGTNLAGATNTSYTIPLTTVTNLGMYSVVASNVVGTNVSTSASLSFSDMKCFPGLVLYGPVGASYAIQSATIAGNLTNWTTITNVTLTESQPFIYLVNDILTPNAASFFRSVPQ